MKSFRCLSLPLLLVLPFACSDEKPAPAEPQTGSTLSAFELAADPGDAIGVVAAKKQGPKDKVVVEGRVHEITKGFAVLKLMDTALEYCGQVNKEDKCKTPWDYCCDSKDDQIEHSLLVELRDADGRPLTAASLPNLRLCDLAKITGKLEQDEHGNTVLIADGLFRAERPTLPDYVKWPQ
jgi:hypothetical protein